MVCFFDMRQILSAIDVGRTSLMPRFYLMGERHTLASALRVELERLFPDDVVACTLVHPLDGHLEILAPNEAAVRAALLAVRDHVHRARALTPRL